ncbi:sulfite exporter TauE/SafE family protein [Polynucleobacter brandtiae]|uniref:Probable membrane transporter protein n=1 Tax=Polynucleobacter brandtiae TaxID=1938816 RepID=A0A2M8VZ27_9BURK|nr:sulfite exporter TauE/SafE family protein [Polynucleobacter brandtiae]PJI83112.1 putative membrane protein YfcA [Polynucleobacter brandtiae]
MHYFVFSIIGIATGFLMAIFGIGGGAFIVPALDVAFLIVPNLSHPPFQLIVIGSLCTIVIGSLPRAIKVVSGHQSERTTATILILNALPFILLGSFLATQLTDNILRLGFSVTIAAIGIWTLIGKSPTIKNSESIQKYSPCKLVVVGAISGISSALFGLGGATLLMPLLTMWVGLPISLCVDISILFVSVTSIVSLVTLSSAWIGVHGANSITPEIITLILILGISAAITQIIAAGKLVKMNNQLRQKLLGGYLIILSLWVIARALI